MSKEAPVPVNETDRLTQHQFKRFAWLAGGLLLLAVFWDAISGFVLHMLFYALEFLELGVEYLLEMLFHLDPYEAQMFTAWIGLGAFLALGIFLYSRAAAYLRGRFHTWEGFWAWLKSKMMENWLFLALFWGVVTAKVLLF